ncbi:MAG: nitroreductase family protein [Lentisphaeria bacterium]|nr:nitroreductase family protein [Lentisphaeria bacterium]
MEFQEVLKRRRSIRTYKPDAVPAEAIEKIKTAVRLAPTACNLQPFKVFFVTNQELKDKICKIYKASWLSAAPAIAVVAGNYAECWKRLEGDPIADVDCAIVMEHITLTAADCGLGTCWICAFPRAEMDAAFGLKSPWKTVAITPVGYAERQPQERPCKSAEELFEVIS